MIMNLTIVSLLALAYTTVATPTKRDAFSDQALSLHNSNRAHYDAGPLNYDTKLAAGAASQAAKCDFALSSGNFGQNLYATAGIPGTIQGAVKSWMDEASKYDYNNPVFSGDTSGFTQVVWKSTTALGCGTRQCTTGSPFNGIDNGKWTYIVCRYTPPGNIQGKFAANVGRPV